MADSGEKIVNFRKPIKPNIVLVLLLFIFLYLIVKIVAYFNSAHIVRYEVKEGSLATDNVYRGVILREETVMTSQASGYVNYYAREGSRVAKNALVYIIDETGRFSSDLEAMSLGENVLTNDELDEFRDEIVQYLHEYNGTNYDRVYDCKFALKNSVLKLANMKMLQQLNVSNGETSSNTISYSYAPTTGIVSYWVDGYEGLRAEDITAATFDTKTEYEKTQLFGNVLLSVGDPIYKLSTSEKWSVVIPVEAALGAQLYDKGNVKVRFLKNRTESWASTDLIVGSDGNTFLKLTFSNSMITYVSDRFIDVELILEEEKGLKIPVSAIINEDFYVVPEDFIISGGNNGGYSVMKQIFLEDGKISSQRTEIDVYAHDKDAKEYYVGGSAISLGNVIYKLDSQETYTISKKQNLTGVYNMNKGYADFTQIVILYQNEEYAIVKSNTKFGLNVYDYIVLDADAIKVNDFVN